MKQLFDKLKLICPGAEHIPTHKDEVTTHKILEYIHTKKANICSGIRKGQFEILWHDLEIAGDKAGKIEFVSEKKLLEIVKRI